MPEVIRWRDKDYLFRNDIGGKAVYTPPVATAIVGFNPDTDGVYRA